MKYIYLRVSSEKQDFSRQYQILKEKSIDYNNKKEYKLVKEKKSGKNVSDRIEYKRLKEKLKKNDTVIVVNFDRLARSMDDFTKERQFYYDNEINLISLDNNQSILNINNDENSNDYQKMVVKIIEVVEGFRSQLEMNLIKERTEAGRQSMEIAIDEKNGKKKRISNKTGRFIGRPSKTNLDAVNSLTVAERDMIDQYLKRKYKYSDIAKNLPFKRTTFFKIIKTLKKESI